MSAKNKAPTLQEQVEALAKLTPLEYDKIRKAGAKSMGVQLKTLDKEVKLARTSAAAASIAPPPDKLIDVAAAVGLTLFHDEMDVAFAEITVGNHLEVWPIESKQFKKWLNNVYWNAHQEALKEHPRKDAISTLAGLAEIQGKLCKVYLRSAYSDGKYYLDLCDSDWRIVEIDKRGWRVLNRSPVKFRRTSTMEALPDPIQGGDYSLLWNLTNIDKPDRLFVLSWIIDSMRENTQCPVLEIVGSHGSAKSTTHKFIRRLFDPNVVDLRGAPKNDNDVWVAAKNNRCVSYENMSTVSAKMQDTLCIIGTGGGHASRALYSDYDESIVKALNPIIINGISPIVTAGDLADRTIRIHVPKLGKNKIRSASKINQAFINAQPSILGGILDLFVGAINETGKVKLTEKPRMLDYSILGEAIGHVTGSTASFTDGYLAMRKGLLIESTQNCPAVMAIAQLVQNTNSYSGTYQDLLSKIKKPNNNSGGDDWPTSARKLSDLLSRHEQGLYAMRIKITRLSHTRNGNSLKLDLI